MQGVAAMNSVSGRASAKTSDCLLFHLGKISDSVDCIPTSYNVGLFEHLNEPCFRLYDYNYDASCNFLEKLSSLSCSKVRLPVKLF